MRSKVCIQKMYLVVFSVVVFAAAAIIVSSSILSTKHSTSSRATEINMGIKNDKPKTPTALYNETILTYDVLIGKYGDRISDEEKASMQKYKKPQVKIWHGSPQLDLNKKTIILGGGLSSNSNQWVGGSQLVKKIFTSLGDKAGEVNVVSIECPGFGNSVIKDGQVTVDTVSAKTYTRDYFTWIKLLGVKPGTNSILAGHSSGGEAVLGLTELDEFDATYNIFALNPAVHSVPSDAFSNIVKLEGISRAVTNSFNNINVIFDTLAHTIVNTVAHHITKHYILAGGSADEVIASNTLIDQQMAVHDAEFGNFEAFWNKCRELVEGDKLKTSHFIKENITFLFPIGDRLTPGADAVSFIQTNFGYSVDEINKQSIEINNSALLGHDAIFYGAGVSDKIASAMVRKLYPDSTPPSAMQTFDLVSALKEEKRKLPLLYVKINKKITDSTKIDIIIQLDKHMRENGDGKKSIAPLDVTRIKTFLTTTDWSSAVDATVVNAANRVQKILLDNLIKKSPIPTPAIPSGDIEIIKSFQRKLLGDMPLVI